MVVAVPLPLPVERHDEAVRALERLQRLPGSHGLEHRVAEAAAHPLEHRRVQEEPGFGLRQPGQQLEAEVLRDEPVVAGKRLGTRRVGRPGLQRERGQVEAGRPALGPPGQLCGVGRVELDPRAPEQRDRLPLVEAEVVHADLVQAPLRPPAGEGQGRLLPARDGDLRARRHVLTQGGEHVEAFRVRDGVQVVEHQHQGMLEGGQRAPETRDARQPGRAARAGQCVENIGRERLEAVERGRDVPQEQDRIVVPPVEGHPRERTRIRLCPQRQERGLAVPGGRRDGRERLRRPAQPRDHVGLRDRAGSGPGRRELRLDEVEGGGPDRHGRRL